MSEPIVCRLCVNPCKDYKLIYDDAEVYKITVKYFDPMFLNLHYHLNAICMDCWKHIFDFYTFQECVFQAKVNAVPMSEFIICRFCVNPCNSYRPIFDDPEVYNITVKYFDPMFLNLHRHLNATCSDCWVHIQDFHTFQECVFQAQIQFLTDKEEKPDLTEFHRQPSSSKHSDVDIENQCPTNNEIITKEELMLTDVADSESSSSSFKDLYIDESEVAENEGTTVPKEKQEDSEHYSNGATTEQATGDMSKKDESPTRKMTKSGTARKRKSIKQLDDLIAEWRPTLECLACQKTFSRYTLLQTHFRQEHSDKEFYVLCCQTKFKRRYSIEEHVRFHLNRSEFKCKICGKGHTTKLNLSSHMSYWHSNAAKEQGERTSTFSCDECGKESRTAGALRKHKQRHKQKQLQCTMAKENRVKK